MSSYLTAVKAYSSHERILVEGLMNHFLPALFFKVEISLCNQIPVPLLVLGQDQSTASHCGQVFPDNLSVSLWAFPGRQVACEFVSIPWSTSCMWACSCDRFPHCGWTSVLAYSDLVGSRVYVCMLAVLLPAFGLITRLFTCLCSNTGVEWTASKC